MRLWLRRLLRDKDERPSTGQAFFCFALILSLTWFSMSLGQGMLIAQAIRYLAFVATPALGMALILTTQPRESLALRWPPLWSLGVALLLALLLLPPLAQITLWILQQFPVIYEYAKETQSPLDWSSSPWVSLLVFAWLPAFCEEVTFRGFILTGLQRRFRPRTAVVISSFLFALFHLNVFQLLPTFFLGLVLAYLTTRCGSILPSILFHLLYNTLILVPALFPDALGESSLEQALQSQSMLWLPALISSPIALWLLWRLTKRAPHPAYVDYLRSDPSLRKDVD